VKHLLVASALVAFLLLPGAASAATCTTSADCVSSAAPVCNLSVGACGCESDLDCTRRNARVCDVSAASGAGRCVAGCRANGGRDTCIPRDGGPDDGGTEAEGGVDGGTSSDGGLLDASELDGSTGSDAGDAGQITDGATSDDASVTADATNDPTTHESLPGPSSGASHSTSPPAPQNTPSTRGTTGGAADGISALEGGGCACSLPGSEANRGYQGMLGLIVGAMTLLRRRATRPKSNHVA